MSASSKILAMIEPDVHPQEVVRRAAWLAELTGSELHLWLCDLEIGSLSRGLFLSNETRDLAREIRSAQEEVIEELAAGASDRGLTVVTSILEERPAADGLMRQASKLQPLFVLKGTEYHSGAERGIFLDTDWQLIRTCPFPLWLVKPNEFNETPVVVAAVDPVHSHDKPAELDQLIVDTAKAITGPTNGELHLFHTYQRIAGIGKAATRTFKPIQLPVDELSRAIQAEHRALLDGLAAANDIDAEHTHQLPGSTKDLLPAFSRTHKTDLVVMGALARWGFRRMIVGSTAEKVLDHLPSDILIVRPREPGSSHAVAI